MSLEQEKIIKQLKLISSLQDGQTLSTSSETIIPHNAWSTTFWRTYYSEDRKKSIEYIKNAFENALILYKEDPSIKINIDNALIGLKNLKLTYKSDHDTRGIIAQIINDTNEEIHQMNNNDTNEEINQINNNNDTFYFFEALKSQNYSLIELYVNNDPNMLNDEKQNGLHIISQQEFYNKDIMDLLLFFHVNPNLKDVHNNTPLYYAIITECTDAILQLEEYNKKLKKKRDL